MPRYGFCVVRPELPEADVQALQEVLTAHDVTDAELELLAGDGSNRRYVRVRSSRPMVAMVLDKSTTPAEAGGEADVGATFCRVQRWLADGALPVPDVFAYDRGRGIVLLEDLGDCWLTALSSDSRAEAYRQAISDLVQFQCLDLATCPLVGQRRYNASLWHWEWMHFVEYGIEVREGLSLPAAVRARAEAALRGGAARLAALPCVPVHRDYHARNLLVDKAGRVRWIDFQDALAGPAVYDVASLLFDAYVELDAAFRCMLWREYCEQARTAGVPGVEKSTFLLAAVHRMLKAAGRFVYFERQGKPQYMQYVPTLLRRVAELVREDAFDADVRAGLAHLSPYVPEWRGVQAFQNQ